VGGGDGAIVVATALVVLVVAFAVTGVAWRGLVVLVVAGGRVVEVVVVGAVVVGSADVVVLSTRVVKTSVPVAAALSDRRMAGSLLRWGNPAMATPTAAHTTSMNAVIVRCPGLTGGPSLWRRYAEFARQPRRQQMSGDQFEDLTRKMAKGTSRRGLLKGMGAAAAASVAAAVLKPFRGDAFPGCPAGTSICGHNCCPAGAACANPSKSCCCAKGQIACGDACCIAGVTCADIANSICGCPKGTTPCGSGANLKCCNKGTACSPTNATCQPVSTFSTTASTCCSDPGKSCSTGSTCCSGVCTSGLCS
jgi:hypothetical protein